MLNYIVFISLKILMRNMCIIILYACLGTRVLAGSSLPSPKK